MGLFGIGNKRKQRQTIGYEYSLGMHMVVGHKNMDGVDRIRVGEKVAWTPSAAHPNAAIQDSFNTGDNASAYSSSVRYDAQTFTVTGQGYYTVSAKLKLLRDAGYSATTTIAIYNVDETGTPDDSSVVVTSSAVAASAITTATAGDMVEFIFQSQVFLSEGTQYALVLTPAAANVYWRYDSAGGYSGGSLYLRNAGVWGISSGNDAMFEVYLAEGNAPNHTIRVDASDLFGGNRKEGGVRGDIDLLFGASDQAQNSYLVSKLSDANLPAFRGSMGFVLNQVYIGTSPYPKPWSFFCRRLLKQVSGDDQWYINKAVINPGVASGDDLNPIHIIRECLVDIDWGMGFDTSDIDSTSFEYAADILYDEDFGLSLLWDQTQPIEDFVGSVLKTIGGFLYQDLSTGKWVLSLTRDANIGTAADRFTEFEAGTESLNTFFAFHSASTPIGEQRRGQVFTARLTYRTNRISFKLGKQDSHTVNLIAELQGVTDGVPNGSVLARGVIDSSSIPSTAGAVSTDTVDWTDIGLSRVVNIINGEQYAVVFYSTTGSTHLSRIYWSREWDGANYVIGDAVKSTDFGATWTREFNNPDFFDTFFRVYGLAEQFNENHIMAIEEFARPSYGEVINQVTVNWWDKIENKPRPVMAQDLALIEKQNNNIIELNLNHYGVCNATLANKIAERELKLVSSMLAAMRLKCTRQMSHLKPNDVFSLSWSALGITQMVVRVIDVDYGSLQKNEIYMTCLEDVFSTAETVFADPPDSEWTDPINDALDISDIDIIEVPYWVLVHDIENQSVVDTDYADDVGYLLLAVPPPTSDSLDFEIFLQQAAEFSFNSEGIASFTFNATLTTGMFKEAQNVTVDIENEFGLTSVLADSYAVIGIEMVKVVSVDTTNNQITLERGVFDTVPEAHAVGDFVYFIGDGYTSLGTEYTDGDQPAFKILPRTGTGQLPEASASTQTADLLDSRFIRPYPPGDLKFNTESFPTFLSTAITGGFEITWAHRDRTHATQVGTIVLHTDATDYGPEVGTTYTIKIYDEDDNLARTVTGIAGTAYEYTEAFEIADSGALQKQLRFEIYSVRDGFDSWLQGYDILIKRTLVGVAAAVSTTTGYLTGGKTLIRGTVAASSAATGTLT